MSPLAGAVYDPYAYSPSVTHLDKCFYWGNASVQCGQRDSDCPLYEWDPRPWWQVSVPTSNSSAAQTVHFWVQGKRGVVGSAKSDGAFRDALGALFGAPGPTMAEVPLIPGPGVTSRRSAEPDGSLTATIYIGRGSVGLEP